MMEIAGIEPLLVREKKESNYKSRYIGGGCKMLIPRAKED
jgi:hypothetical protein